MRFQTKSQIESLLSDAGIKPRRRWGQNFLIDGNLLQQLLDAADLQPHDVVLEVGTGTGAVTEHLVQHAKDVIAVEIDAALFAIVSQRLTDADNLTLIHGDVLASKHRLSDVVNDALREASRSITADKDGTLVLVANLPYNIATPLLIDLLLGPHPFTRYCFTVQRELADRLTAAPRTKDYGPISVLLQATCTLTRLADLPASVFWPRPAVESTMMRVDVTKNPFDSIDGLNRFAQFVRAAFFSRRKTLKFNLTRAVGPDRCKELADAVDLRRRPEELTVEEWIHLATMGSERI